MRVMLDTNVLISAIIFRSPTLSGVVEIASRPGNRLLLPTFVLDESREVVSRKWPGRRAAFERFVSALSFDVVTTPQDSSEDLPYIRDPDDYPVLLSALTGCANVLVTGDKDFGGVEVPDLAIMTPAEFVKRFGCDG